MSNGWTELLWELEIRCYMWDDSVWKMKIGNKKLGWYYHIREAAFVHLMPQVPTMLSSGLYRRPCVSSRDSVPEGRQMEELVLKWRKGMREPLRKGACWRSKRRGCRKRVPRQAEVTLGQGRNLNNKPGLHCLETKVMDGYRLWRNSTIRVRASIRTKTAGLRV